jgi:chromosome segregation ATPase
VSDSDATQWWPSGSERNESAAAPPPAKGRRSRWAIAFGVLSVVLVAVVVGVSLIAARQNSVAAQWRDRDRGALSDNRALAKNLAATRASAKASIASLNSNIKTLTGHVSKLSDQLSAVADAKEKALDQDAVLSQLNTEADTVTGQLSTCVDDMNSLLSELSTDLGDGNGFVDPGLDSTAETANDDCATAQQDNDELQTTLSGAG